MQPRGLRHPWQEAITGWLPGLASGVHPKVAGERLGHNKVAAPFTCTVPSCPAARVDEALLPALQKRPCEILW